MINRKSRWMDLMKYWMSILLTISMINCDHYEEITNTESQNTSSALDAFMGEDDDKQSSVSNDQMMMLAGMSTDEMAGSQAGMEAGSQAGTEAGNQAGTSAGQENHSSMNFISSRQRTVNFPFTYDRSVTAGNPFKGFLTSYQWATPSNDLSHGLEFSYLPLSEIIQMEGSYNFDTSIEPLLVSSASRGHHMILRIYIDYPSRESGLPDYLQDDVSCYPYSDYGGGCAPNYQDPVLQTLILEFIQRFATRYDGDRRIAFIQIGLLGFWGEWHTYPHNDWFADDAFQQEVIRTFDESFAITPIQLRVPVQDSPQRAIGFHDDSFAYSTLGDINWFFWPKMIAAQADQRWISHPMGGEVYPELQRILFTPNYVLDTYRQDIMLAIETTHMSYLVNYQAFNLDGVGYRDEQLQLAQQASNAMGYEFTVDTVELTAKNLHNEQIDVQISIMLKNSGVAPFYYPLSLILESIETGESWSIESELHALLPSEQHTQITFDLEEIHRQVITQGFRLKLSSEHLLDDQLIRWANSEQNQGALVLANQFVCHDQTVTVSVGETIMINDDTCFCDVDGVLYTSGQVSCIR